jgi:hypothetical protein
MVHENSFNRYIFISTHVDNIKTFIIKEADSYMMNQNYCTKIELHIANSYLPCLKCDINLYISSTWFSYNWDNYAHFCQCDWIHLNSKTICLEINLHISLLHIMLLMFSFRTVFLVYVIKIKETTLTGNYLKQILINCNPSQWLISNQNQLTKQLKVLIV